MGNSTTHYTKVIILFTTPLIFLNSMLSIFPFYTSFNQWLISGLLKSKHWKIKSIFFSVGFIILVTGLLNTSFPKKYIGLYYTYTTNLSTPENIKNYNDFLGKYWIPGNFHWKSIQEQASHPRTFAINHNFDSHEESMNFRIIVPIIVRLVGLHDSVYAGLFFMLSLQFLVGLLLLYLAITLAYRITNDKLISFYFSTAFAGIYVGGAMFIGAHGHLDTFGYFLMVASLVARNRYYSIFFLFLSYWSDERALISSPLVFICYLFLNESDTTRTLKTYFKSKSTYLLIGSWVLYFLLRFSVTKFIGIKTGTHFLYFHSFIISSDSFVLRVGGALEFFFIPIFLLLFNSYKSLSKTITFWLVVMATFVGIFSAMMVADTVRSSAYCFPLIFMSLLYLMRKKIPIEIIQQIYFIVMLLNVLYPYGY